MNNAPIAALDLAKKQHDVYFQGAYSVLANQPSSFEPWLDRLPQGTIIAMESTGSFGLPLAEAATRKGFTVYVLSPRQVANYRRALGRRAKTDRKDAKLIHDHVAASQEHLRPFVIWEEPWRSLRSMVRERATLVAKMASARQSMRARGRSKQDIHAALSSLKAYTDFLYREIGKQVSKTPEGKALLKLAGVGPILAGASLAALGQIPFSHKDAFVAWTGNDLIVDDSATRKGVRKVSSWGDKTLRCAFFNGARAAVRTLEWKDYYQAKLDAGFCKTQAICALARKLQRKVYGVYNQAKRDAQQRLAMQP